MPESPRPGASTQRPLGEGFSDQPGFRPIGATTQGAPQMLTALSGMVTNLTTVSQEQERAQKEILAMSERTSMLMGSVIDRYESVLNTARITESRQSRLAIVGGATSLVDASGRPLARRPASDAGDAPESKDAKATAEAAAPPAADKPSAPGVTAPDDSDGREGVKPSSDAPAGMPTSLPGQGGKNVEGAVESEDDEEEERPYLWPTSWSEGKRLNVGKIRQNMATNTNIRLTKMAEQQEQEYEDPETGETKIRMVPRGSPSVGAHDDPGWRARAVARGQNFSGAVAAGKSPGQAAAGAAQGSRVLMTGVKAAGVAGAAYMGVNTALNFAEKQQSSNQEFQQQIGGEASEGFSERWDQNLFRLSQRGRMGGRDAEAIYKGAASAYGRDDEMRGRYQDAAVQINRDTGLDARGAMRFLDQAVEDGNKNLRELARAIKDVGEAAVESGQSAEHGRELFQRALQGTGQYATGSTQIQVAQAQTGAVLGLGTQLQDTDLSGQNSELFQRRLAQRAGMSYAEWVGVTAGDQPGSAQLVTETTDMMVEDTLSRSVDPSVRAEINRRLQEAAANSEDGRSLTPDDITRIGHEVMQDELLGDPASLAGSLNVGANVNTTAMDVGALVVQHEAGNFSLEDKRASEQDALQDVQVFEGDEDDRMGLLSPVSDQQTEVSDDWIEDLEDRFGYENIRNKTSRKNQEGLDTGDGGWSSNRSMSDRVRNAVINRAILPGEDGSDPALLPLAEKFWTQLETLGDDAVYKVKTKEGYTTVNGVELIENFSDQLQHSPEDIEIIGGNRHGERLHTALGVEPGMGDQSKITSDTNEDLVDVGETVEDAEKRVGKDAEGDSSRVEISMEPRLMDLLEVSVNGRPLDRTTTRPNDAEDAYSRGTNAAPNHSRTRADRTGNTSGGS